MRKSMIAALLVGVAGISLYPNEASAQRLSLESCWEKAEQNYPLTQQYGWIEKTKEYNLSNAGKRYLPQLTLGAKATYQSEVTPRMSSSPTTTRSSSLRNRSTRAPRPRSSAVRSPRPMRCVSSQACAKRSKSRSSTI